MGGTPKSKYQVSLYHCPAPMPFSAASHGWFVVRKGNDVSRYEIVYRLHASEPSWGYIHKNYRPPEDGIEMFLYTYKWYWDGHPIGSVEGDEGSLAERMATFIERSPEHYPYRDTYSYAGPNSNTYPQWVLNHFPEFPYKLPWNSFGMHYGKKT